MTTKRTLLGEVDGETIALGLLVATEVYSSFSCFMPSAYEIRAQIATGPNAAANVAALRGGYLPALLWSAGLTALVALLTKSTLPIVFGVGAATLAIGSYESALPVEHRLLAPANPYSARPVGGCGCHQLD